MKQFDLKILFKKPLSDKFQHVGSHFLVTDKETRYMLDIFTFYDFFFFNNDLCVFKV